MLPRTYINPPDHWVTDPPLPYSQAVRCGEGFRFSGLDVDADLVLFATATREGKTWSARRLVRSGGGDVKLVLADEDPDLGR